VGEAVPTPGDRTTTTGDGGVRSGEKVGTDAGGVRLGLSVLAAEEGCFVLAGGVTDAGIGKTCTCRNLKISFKSVFS